MVDLNNLKSYIEEKKAELIALEAEKEQKLRIARAEVDGLVKFYEYATAQTTEV